MCEHRTLSPWWAVFSCLILWRVRSLCLVAFNWSSLVWSGRSASNLLTGLLRVSQSQYLHRGLNWSSQSVTNCYSTCTGAGKPATFLKGEYICFLLGPRPEKQKPKTLVVGWHLVHWSAIPLMSTMFVHVSTEKLPRKFARKPLNLWIQRVPPPDRTTFGSIVQR